MEQSKRVAWRDALAKPVGSAQQPDPPATADQQAIIDLIADKDGPSVLIQAGAGTGKTNTLKRAAPGVKGPGLAMAFNRRNVDDLLKVMPSSFVCKSINGVGHGAWMKARGKFNMKPDARKAGKIITEIAKQRRVQLASDQWSTALDLFREAQIQGLVPEPFGHQYSTLVPDTKDGWQALADNKAILEDDFNLVWELVREALLENIRLAFQGIISFDDQIYCSTLLGGQFAQFPNVWGDEDQDFTPLNVLMMSKCLTPDGRIAAVGDKYQSIYAFRGAIQEAAEEIRKLRDRWADLPLMTSFRCPKLIVERQQGHVPGYQAHSGNIDGQIITVDESKGWSWDWVMDNVPYQENVAVVCRNNAPIISLAFRLIRQGIGCHVLGREMSKGLVALSKKIAPKDDISAERVVGHIDEWLNKELAKARIADNEDAVDKFTDKAETLKAIMASAECQNAGQLRTQIEKLFSRESGQVTLSTIHKAKGLEWPAVVHLDSWRVPSKRAKTAGGRALEQEHNLRYVAETRTKHTLIEANLESFE